MFVPRRTLKRITESEFFCAPRSKVWLCIDAIPVIWFGAFTGLIVAAIFGFMKPPFSVRVFALVFLIPWGWIQWSALRSFLLTDLATTSINCKSDYVMLTRAIAWHKSTVKLEKDRVEDVYASGRSRAVFEVYALHRGKHRVVERGLSEKDAELLTGALSKSLLIEV